MLREDRGDDAVSNEGNMVIQRPRRSEGAAENVSRQT